MNARFLLISFICIVVATGSDPTSAQTWQSMDSGTTMWLSGIWGFGPDNVFVVGAVGTILHYNGHNWALMSSPTGSGFGDVTGWSATSAVAVGQNKTILRYNGTSWNLVTGIPGEPSDGYFDVWGTGPNNFFAVGEQNYGSAPPPILHWDGVSWNRRTIDLPSSALGMSFTSVWGQSTDDVYVGGTSYYGGSTCYGVLYHFDGFNWTQDLSLPVGRSLDAMWGDGPDLFLVGSATGYPNQPGIMWRFGASGWQTHTMSMGWDPTLLCVWGSASNDVYAVGYNDTIVHYDGNGTFNWTFENPGTSGVRFNSIWGSSTNDIFVVGSGGTIFHRHVNATPVAICQDVLVAVGTDGYVDASIDGGSYDPDGDDIDLSQEPIGPYLTGVYNVKLTVTDPYGASDRCQAMLVVYDPSGGFMTGGGWIWSPKGAYATDPWLEGKANFGFVSKYKKGANVPTGQTEFVFQAGDLNFHSSSYDWLVVAGAKAMFKGVGTINGNGDYGFMLSAVDAALTPSTSEDRFRIKIWDKNAGDVVVYDNQMDDDDNADVTTAIGGGSIVIHTK